MRSRDADDLVCAFRFRHDADWFSQALPTRRGTVKLEGAPEKTHVLRCRRFQPGMTRRFISLGVEFYWQEDRQGGPRVTRRTARKRGQRACQRSKAWRQANRHVPGKAVFTGLKARVRGHYRYDGVPGNSHALQRFVAWAMACALTWLNRRGGQRRSVRWPRFTQRLEAVPLARPRITEPRRRRVYA